MWCLFRQTVLKHLLLKADIWPERLTTLQKCLLAFEFHKQKALFDEDERGLWIDTSMLRKEEKDYVFVAMCDTLHRYMDAHHRVYPADMAAAVQEALVRCRRARRKRAVRLEQLEREHREHKAMGRKGCLSRIIRWQRLMSVSVYGADRQEPRRGRSCWGPRKETERRACFRLGVRACGAIGFVEIRAQIHSRSGALVGYLLVAPLGGTFALQATLAGTSACRTPIAGKDRNRRLQPMVLTLAGFGRHRSVRHRVVARPCDDSQAEVPTKYLLLETDLGSIKMILRPDSAPRTVEHVCRLVDAGLYDGCYFYRSDFVLQWGLWLPEETEVENPYPELAENETNIGTFISNQAGTVSIAHGIGVNGNSDIFINLQENSYLDTMSMGFCVFAQLADADSRRVAKEVAAAVEERKPASIVSQGQREQFPLAALMRKSYDKFCGSWDEFRAVVVDEPQSKPE
ncbi:unnamed protein product [Effrenium voratum]|uniref:peptidylprolyl isomerase n=1 Tax=Effrenium voratum TaxID=2562239 RepID=A0AA36I989_9DINO|nr:unnamed protein product [Effrenium voratum]